MGKIKQKKFLFLKIFVAVLICTLCIFIAKAPLEMLLKLKGDVSNSSATGVSYKDWSELTSVDSDYSNSNISYLSNTKIYANITPNDDAETKHSSIKVQTNKIEGNVATPFIELYGLGSKAQIIVQNCGYDTDGNSISAVLEVENVERWNEEGDSKYRTEFSIDDLLINQGVYEGRKDPTVVNTYHEEKTKVNTPMSFYLKTYYGVAKLKVTYYKSLVLSDSNLNYYTELKDENQMTGKAVDRGIVSLTNSVIANNVTKVNSYYSDLDIVSNSRFMTTNNYGDPNDYMFYSKEGLAPMNGESTIYYNEPGYSIEYEVEDPSILYHNFKVNLKPYTDSSKNIHGIFVENDDFDGWIENGRWITNVTDEYSTGLHGTWQGDSIQILTSGLSGEYEMIYGGANNGAWINFMSVQSYDNKAPVKRAIYETSPLLTKDNYKYELEFENPFTYPSDLYANEISMYVSHPTVFSDTNEITGLSIEDQIDSSLTINGDITIKNGYGDNLTGSFNNTVSSNKVTVTAKSEAINQLITSERNRKILVTIPVVQNSVLEEETTYDNSATLNISKGETNKSLTSNETNTTIKSPKLIYNCSANGGTGDQTIYLNPGDDIDLTKVCSIQGGNFVGWSNESNSESILTESTVGKMGRTDRVIYGIYSTPSSDEDPKYTLIVTTPNETKVYDKTPLVANNRCSDTRPFPAPNTGLKEGHRLECTNTGSITDVGTATKVISEVRVLDENDEDVSDEYNIYKIDGLLEVTPLEITIETPNQTREYNGTYLEADNRCTSNGLLSGDTVTCVTTGSRKDVGDEPKVIVKDEVVIRNENQAPVTNNYTIKTKNATLTITPKEIYVSTTPETKVYDGTPLVADNTCTPSALIDGDRIECTNGGSRTKIGVTPKTIDNVVIYNSENVDITNNYRITGKEDSTLTITGLSITVKAKNQTKVYDGEPLNADNTCELIQGSLISGHTISCTNNGTITNVGDADKVLSTVKVLDSNNQDVSENYLITPEDAKLIITPKEVKITPTDQTKVYDGDALEADNNCSSVGLLSGHIAECSNEGEITNVGNTKKTITSVIIKDRNGENVSTNYNIETDEGTLTITPRTITVTATNQEKEYDRTPLNANNECSITAGSLAKKSDTITCVNTGSITNVGEEPKVIQSYLIKDVGGNNTNSNYIVNTVNGILKVTPIHNDIILDDGEADIPGTDKIIEFCDDAIYLDINKSSKLVPGTGNRIILPTKVGYTFEGYYTSLEEDGLLAIDREGYITGNIVPTVCKDRTIYAKWTKKKFKLTVIPNNGKPDEEYSLEYKEQKQIEDPKKELYEFDGWILTGGGSTYVNKTFTMGYQDAILEAKYVCSNKAVSSVYDIDDNKKVIQVNKEDTTDIIKNNIKSCCDVEVTDDEVKLLCGKDNITYKIKRYWKPQTGVAISRFAIIISLLLVITTILFIVKDRKQKLVSIEETINKD